MNSKTRDFVLRFMNQARVALARSRHASFDKSAFEEFCKKKFIFGPSYPTYGSQGLLDMGPLLTPLLHNLVSEWRRHFVMQERMYEVSASILTPERVMQASGHAERFTDFVCRDQVTGERYRVDHLIKDELKKRIRAGKLDDTVLDQVFQKTMPVELEFLYFIVGLDWNSTWVVTIN